MQANCESSMLGTANAEDVGFWTWDRHVGGTLLELCVHLKMFIMRNQEELDYHKKVKVHIIS